MVVYGRNGSRYVVYAGNLAFRVSAKMLCEKMKQNKSIYSNLMLSISYYSQTLSQKISLLIGGL